MAVPSASRTCWQPCGSTLGGPLGFRPIQPCALDDLAKVQRLLSHSVAKEWWDMEEGCLTAQWRAASAG
ncbi:hypothetical protein GCM10010521_30410 [Streptomyces rameus]|uniref:Acetyltransferase n=1 Tax=Streptomyces rameus TaxID=68261 RepID=A0ABP6NC91_9ACTN